MFRILVSRLPKLMGWSTILCGASLLFCQNVPVNKSATLDPSVSTYQPHMAFDVISIHESREGDISSIDNMPDISRYTAERVAPAGLILGAYDLNLFQLLENLPAWAMTTKYTTTAKSDASTDEALAKLSNSDGYAEKRHMLQLLLAERFHLQIHPETRVVTTYELVATPRATKLMTPVQGDVAKTISTCIMHPAEKGLEIVSKGCPFPILLNRIREDLGTNILDHTGMTGIYAYHLMWKPSAMPTREGEEHYPDIVNAVHEQLGLELKQTKGPVTFWVVDHIERPTPN